MMGTITIKDLKIHSYLGVYPEERGRLQEIILDLHLNVNISQCVMTDSLEDTINYEEVVKIAYELFSQEHYFLIETFAYALTRRLFEAFALLYVKVIIKKRGALPLAQYAGITLEMSREEYLCLGS